jgi:hypothetical protein
MFIQSNGVPEETNTVVRRDEWQVSQIGRVSDVTRKVALVIPGNDANRCYSIKDATKLNADVDAVRALEVFACLDRDILITEHLVRKGELLLITGRKKANLN